MESIFTVSEKRKWMLKKHLKDHAFEYVLDIVLSILYSFILLKLCKAENMVLGVAVAFVWSLGRVVWQIYCYKKEYVDIDIK